MEFSLSDHVLYPHDLFELAATDNTRRTLMLITIIYIYIYLFTYGNAVLAELSIHRLENQR